jgi:hypothetical protein
LIGSLDLMHEHPPDWDQGDFHYWFYGTLVMVQCGSNYWNRWSAGLKKTLLSNQVRDGDNEGSWDPHAGYDREGGRAWTTAVGAYCLPIYPRFVMYR